MAQLQALADAIIAGNRVKTAELTAEALSAGMPAKQILDEGLIAGMAVVGEKFKNCEFYVPEVLVAARAGGGDGKASACACGKQSGTDRQSGDRYRPWRPA